MNPTEILICEVQRHGRFEVHQLLSECLRLPLTGMRCLFCFPVVMKIPLDNLFVPLYIKRNLRNAEGDGPNGPAWGGRINPVSSIFRQE